MGSELEELLKTTPASVAFRDFNVHDDIDLRRSCVDVLFANTIGINAESADWLPNDDPPDQNERLAWIWFVRPDLGNEMIDMISDNFRLRVECYRDGRMKEWWAHMTDAQ